MPHFRPTRGNTRAAGASDAVRMRDAWGEERSRAPRRCGSVFRIWVFFRPRAPRRNGIAKKKGNQLYYYVVESARVDGQPRIYLGTADQVAALVKDRTSPVPVSAASRDFGLPGALWLAAKQTVFLTYWTLWPAPRSGPSVTRYLLLAAIHASVNRDRRRRWPIGTAKPFCILCWEFRRSASLRKPSGTL